MLIFHLLYRRNTKQGGRMMKCLILVKFLAGGSLSPDEFFSRIGALWSWADYIPPEKNTPNRDGRQTQPPRAREGICIADYESVEQFSIDLAIMPGAGISSVEVIPITEKTTVPNTVHNIHSA